MNDAREQRPARHRVLIIDDEESTRLLLARYLSKDLKIEAQLAGTASRRCARRRLCLRRDPARPADARHRRPGSAQGNPQRLANAATPVVVISVVSDQETIERA